MRVRTQTFVPGARKHQVKGRWIYPNAVKIISLDQFIMRARKLGGYRWTPRELLCKLVLLPIDALGSDTKSLKFSLASGGIVCFWLER